MDEARQKFYYRVCGFGGHTDWKTVEFVEEIDDEQVCNWCGVVSAELAILPCLHRVCEECRTVAYEAELPACGIDKQTLSSAAKDIGTTLERVLGVRVVRCVNVGSGCDYSDSLVRLSDHLCRSCAFYLKECPKCEEALAYKDLASHYKKCKGVAGIFLQSADTHSLLEDMGNARNELEQRLSSTNSNIRDAVGLIMEQLEILRRHLTARSHGRLDDGMLNDCNQ
ncbi:TNF receptor-associated factor 5-like [Dermacentor variabilis]|uniref:TNF receptor-associated factor 5-like n=1 Tax=Dermacentor variabilis TaxID=34621 RepID=UPI003F5C28B7